MTLCKVLFMASAPVFAAQRGRLFLKLQKITFDKLVSIEALKAFLVLRKKEKIQSPKVFEMKTLYIRL